jgi:predicted nucleic acid-binding protein
MRIYLDNCAFNRPFDDQNQLRIRLESETKLYLQEKVQSGKIELVWSYMLDIENDQNPFREKRAVIAQWKKFAVVDIEETEGLVERAEQLVVLGIKTKDALHVAAATEGKADYFVSTDDKLLRKLSGIRWITAMNPINLSLFADECTD